MHTSPDIVRFIRQHRPLQLYQQRVQFHKILLIPRILSMSFRLRVLSSVLLRGETHLLIIIITIFTILAVSLFLLFLRFRLGQLFSQCLDLSLLCGRRHIRNRHQSTLQIPYFSRQTSLAIDSAAQTTQSRGNTTRGGASNGTERIRRVDYPRRRLISLVLNLCVFLKWLGSIGSGIMFRTFRGFVFWSRTHKGTIALFARPEHGP